MSFTAKSQQGAQQKRSSGRQAASSSGASSWSHLPICSKLHAKPKAQRNQRISQTFVCAWIGRATKFLGFVGFFLSEPSLTSVFPALVKLRPLDLGRVLI